MFLCCFFSSLCGLEKSEIFSKEKQRQIERERNVFALDTNIKCLMICIYDVHACKHVCVRVCVNALSSYKRKLKSRNLMQKRTVAVSCNGNIKGVPYYLLSYEI